MAGKDRRTCPNVEMWPDSERMRMCMHRVLEGDGRRWWALNVCSNQPEGWPLGPVVGQTASGAGEWWWASNECARLPKEGPLGPVLKQSHSRMWVTRWATASKCGDVTGFGTCMAAPGCGKIDKMSMERVYGGHIMVHHPWGKWLVGWCAYVGTSWIGP